MDEVHGLVPAAENQRGLAVDNPFHPADQYLGVEAVDVHAGSVNVEVPQQDVVQA
ncbi:hypothetical protein D3C73_1333850 [compost metagenome]